MECPTHLLSIFGRSDRCSDGITRSMQVFDMLAPMLPSERMDVVQAIRQHYVLHGMAIFRVLSEQQCRRNLAELWNKVVRKQPLKAEAMTFVPDAPDPDADPAAFDEWAKHVVFPPLPPGSSPAQVKKRRRDIRMFTDRLGLLHAGFGAACDPDVFHLQGSWDVRQNKLIYKVCSWVLGIPNLWCDINRCIEKPPGVGEDPFVHTDVNPFHDDADNEDEALQGKVMYTTGKFVGLPGSHSKEFYEALRRVYGPLYPACSAPNSRKVKFGIDPAKDPWDLWSKCMTFEVPAGCMVIWNKRMVHGHSKTPLHRGAEYGLYIGFMRAVSRPEYVSHSRAVMKAENVTFTDEERRLKGITKEQAVKGLTEEEVMNLSFTIF